MANKQKTAVNDKPFDGKTLSKARRAVEDYRFAFWREEGRYVGQCVEMDTLGIGDTVEDCIAEAKVLAITGLAHMLESGKRPPLPARNQPRNIQVNIQLSLDEKRAIEEAASKGGFRGISDYLRIRGLSMS
jgi:predicted RNase H-like HicB family nuclease